MMLLSLSFLWTLPLGLVVLSWLGAKFGARAPLALFFPIPIVVTHFSAFWLTEGGVVQGVAAASEAASATMDSVPMAFCWAIPYFYLSKLLSRVLKNAKLVAMLSFVGATLASAGLELLYHPLWAFIDGPTVQLVAVVVVLLAAQLVLWLPRAERTMQSAVPTVMSLAGRVLTMLLIIFSLVFAFFLPPPLGPVVLAVLHAFPRLTFEMAVSTHVTNGLTASRQLLTGLPVGVSIAAVWCYALVFLPMVAPAEAVLPIALVLTTVWWSGVIAVYVRMYGVFRAENGFF